jgi:hypothetical protein
MDNLDVYALKEEYGDVYLVTVFEEQYLFRLITRKEYYTIDTIDCTDEEKEELIVSCCLIDRELTQEDIDMSHAGIVSVICEAIMRESGLSEESAAALGYQYYEEMQDSDNKIDAVIMEAFPSIRLEEIENWTVNKTLKYFSRAEWILSNLRGINVVPLLQPQGQTIDYIDSNDRNY